ncbi:Tetratricopeptide repeat (TPR)-like superfamily protein [Euphorbia peplus]|nr:Tetratricopeptide repeat (TPR)-like superfamily protein [Euphorbia peplus]
MLSRSILHQQRLKEHVFCYLCTAASSITAPPISPYLVRQCKSIVQVNQIHQQTLIHGLFPQFSISLISTYFALNCTSHSLSILQTLTPSPAAVSWWNSLIQHALRHGLVHTSLSIFRKMLCLGWSPDNYTLTSAFKACGELPSFRHGTCLHTVVCSTGFHSDVFVCSTIVTMYGRCGALASASQMFDEMCQTQVFNLVSWNSIVSAYMHNGDSKNAIGLFRTMCASGCDDVKPDAVSLVTVLPAFASMGDWLHGKKLHGFAMRSGLFENVFVASSLVDMYAKCGMMEEADKVFKRMNNKNVVTWNSMVTGYSQLGRFEEALGLFKKMRTENIDSDVVSWSAIIAGYAQRECGYEALDVFRQMQVSGVKPNELTLSSLLSGSASVGALCQGKEAHCYAIKSFLKFDRSDPRDELFVMTAIIDMYAKCKSIIVARAIFDSTAPNDRNVVTWNAMIGGYAQHGEGKEALELFSRMLKQDRSLKPDAYTISFALTACGSLAALRSGKQIHAYALRNQFGSDVVVVANCLINMYSKCGDNDVARIVFNNMKHRNTVSWNTLMTGYGMHGHGEEALKVLDEMINEGLAPDSVTFLVVLYACSHFGMVDEGIKYFDTMSAKYGITPGQEHYCSMVDLFGRAGWLDEAMNLINGMPMEPDPLVWTALLGGCRKYANVEIGEFAANKLRQLESRESGAYTLLSNIYANAK